MSGGSSPKVFISHATEDKNRFVLKFAEELRANGVDAWLDKWEMLPGDSLVDKIFEEGIKGASAFIVVLSATSVAKPWVREELNAGFVKRLSGKCRIIPVVLDNCEVPECLRSTLWQRIVSLDDYSDEFKQILNSIFGLSDKPPIGPAPVHSQMVSVLNVPSLHKIDNLVLDALCEESVRANDTIVSNLSCLDAVVNAGATDNDIRDALKILDDERYIESTRVMGPGYRNSGVLHVRIPTHTFDKFARAKWPDYDSVLEQIVSGLVNEGWHSKVDLEKVNAPERLREHLVRLLEDNGHIQASWYYGGFSIWDVSPKLRRALSGA